MLPFTVMRATSFVLHVQVVATMSAKLPLVVARQWHRVVRAKRMHALPTESLRITLQRNWSSQPIATAGKCKQVYKNTQISPWGDD